MSKIKICGIYRKEDIDIINLLKPDYIGFILNYTRSHRYIDMERAEILKSCLDRDIEAVGVFVDARIEDIETYVHKGIIDRIQLHGNEDEEYIKKLQQRTDMPLIKAFRIKDKKDIDKAFSSICDDILIDTGMGEGKEHSLEHIRYIKECMEKYPKKQVFLAGGIRVDMIPKIAKIADFYAYDVSSSVESERIKDEKKIAKVIEEIRKIS